MTNLHVIETTPLADGIESIVLHDPDRFDARAILLRCKTCGRGALARLIEDKRERVWKPDGDVTIAHLEWCPVLLAALESAGKAS